MGGVSIALAGQELAVVNLVFALTALVKAACFVVALLFGVAKNEISCARYSAKTEKMPKKGGYWFKYHYEITCLLYIIRWLICVRRNTRFQKKT